MKVDIAFKNKIEDIISVLNYSDDYFCSYYISLLNNEEFLKYLYLHIKHKLNEENIINFMSFNEDDQLFYSECSKKYRNIDLDILSDIYSKKEFLLFNKYYFELKNSFASPFLEDILDFKIQNLPLSKRGYFAYSINKDEITLKSNVIDLENTFKNNIDEEFILSFDIKNTLLTNRKNEFKIKIDQSVKEDSLMKLFDKLQEKILIYNKSIYIHENILKIPKNIREREIGRFIKLENEKNSFLNNQKLENAFMFIENISNLSLKEINMLYNSLYKLRYFDILRVVSSLFISELKDNFDYQNILNLKLIDNLTYKEISDKLDIPQQKVRSTYLKFPKIIKKNDEKYNLKNIFEKTISVRVFEKEKYQKDMLDLYNQAFNNIKYNQDYNFYYLDNVENEVIKVIKYIKQLQVVIKRVNINIIVESIKNFISYKLSTDEIYIILKSIYSNQYGIYISQRKLTLVEIYQIIISIHFPEGLDIYQKENLRKIKSELENGFSVTKNSSLESISKRLQEGCKNIGRRLWIVDDNLNLIDTNLLSKIFNYIMKSKYQQIPISSIYSNFKNILIEKGINNKIHLQSELKNTKQFDLLMDRFYVYKDINNKIHDQVEKFIQKEDKKLSKEDILNKFNDYDENIINNILSVSSNILLTKDGYIHISKLIRNEREENEFISYLEELTNDNSIQNTSLIVKDENYKKLDFVIKNEINDYFMLYSLLRKLYFDRFEVFRPYFAKKGVEMLSSEEQVVERIIEKEEVKIKDIKDIQDEILGKNLSISLNKLIDKNIDSFIFKDQETLIINSCLSLDKIDQKEFDNLLDNYMQDCNERNIDEFDDYDKLPDIKIKYNKYVLYSLINMFSNNYEAIFKNNKINGEIYILKA